jgi:hypothetical protein
MGFVDRDDRPAAARTLISARFRPRPPRRFVSEFENEIRQLYVGTIDEPIPSRMIEVLRAGLAGAKP